MREHNLKLNIVGIARSTRALFDREGVDGPDYRERLAEGMPITPARLRDEVIGMNIFNSVFVDCTASAEVAALYKDFFEHGISVVTANKIAASSEYANYKDLKDTSLKRGVKFLFETNVGAGLPVINTINALCNSGDRIEKIEAVLSGTLNFICNTISSEVPFSRTVKMAQEQGFSEPDPRIDLSGKDVIRKLVILAREAGYQVEQSDVEAQLFVPDELFHCSMEEFWAKLPPSTRSSSKSGNASRPSTSAGASSPRWKTGTTACHCGRSPRGIPSMSWRVRTISSCSLRSATTSIRC